MKLANCSFNSHFTKCWLTSLFGLAPNSDHLSAFKNINFSPKSGFPLSFEESGDLTALKPRSGLAKLAMAECGSPHMVAPGDLREPAFLLPTPGFCRCEVVTGADSWGIASDKEGGYKPLLLYRHANLGSMRSLC